MKETDKLNNTECLPILEMKQISKAFPGVQALDHVDFDLLPGEVHVLVGENGAGKSTLMKVLTGAYPYDEGEIFINQTHSLHWNPTIARSQWCGDGLSGIHTSAISKRGREHLPGKGRNQERLHT